MRARGVVLGVGLAWALFVSLPAHAGIESFAISFGVALAPYVALAAVGRWLRLGVLVTAMIGVLGVNVATLVGVRDSASSTAAVAMLLAPIALAVVLAPIALMGSKLRAWSGRHRGET
jgi:hypothetical protein